MECCHNRSFPKSKYHLFDIWKKGGFFRKKITVYLMLCCSFILFQQNLNAQCSPDIQYDVLAALYNANNASSPNPLDWNLSDCDICNWDGVTCINGNISKLELSNKQLTTIPSEIGQLTSLIDLILNNNQLSTLPTTIGQLSNLDKLVISNNQFSSLPIEIGQLSNLKLLEVNNNTLTALPTEIGGLTSLINLALTNNQLTALPTELGQLSNLLFFNATQNELTTLPASIGQMTNLMFLNLQSNQLSCLPTELSNLYDNVWLITNPNFTNNPNLPFGFTWEDFISSGIGTCCLSDNYDASQHDALTAVFNENPLSQTDLGWNIWDCDYCTWSGVTCNLAGQITSLDISNKQITSLPIELAQLTNLTDLNVSSNQLSCFPIELSTLCNNSVVPDITNNPLLPEAFTWSEFCTNGFGACCPFTYFDSTQYNALVAIYYANDIDTQNSLGWNLNDCHYNTWNGVTCNNIGQVTELRLTNNQITAIPTQIKDLTSLVVLDFNNNQLTDLPIEIALLPNLGQLEIDNNQLSCIPTEFNIFCSSPNFIASFENNPNLPSNFSWENFCSTGIASCCQIENFDATQYEALTSIYFANSAISQNAINWNLSNCDYCTWSGVVCDENNQVTQLSLSGKQLTTIPSEIELLSNLTSLVFFQNQLTSFPVEFYNLTNLTSLNFGINQVASLAPEIGQLTNLTNLVAFNNQISCLPAELNVLCTNGASPPLLFGNPLPAGFNWSTFCNTGLGSSTRYYEDFDADGFGNPDSILDACSQPIGYVLNNTDCNDDDENINTAQPFFIDADGDGFGSDSTEMICVSTVPFGYALNNTDCNDNDSTVNTPQLFYIDADGDGFGSDSTEMICVSTVPFGYATNNTDCNDNDSTVNTPQLFYIDADGDGFGSNSTEMICASIPPIGFADNNSDCNDADALIHPNALEICDDIDNNCDGQIDEDLPCTPPYCEAAGQNTSYEWIESISINNNINTSDNNDGYQDYTDVILPVSTGSNSIQLTPGFAGKHYREYWIVYIDLNQDGSFENSEIVFYKKSKHQINSNFNIPNTALAGQTRMRIIMRYGTWSFTCNDFPDGEIEDYTVNISICDQLLDGGQIGNGEILCEDSNDPAEITNLSTPTDGSGLLEYVWLMNTTTSELPTTANMNGWIEIPNSNTASYDPMPISQTTWYLRCARRVGCTSFMNESNVIEKTYYANCGINYCSAQGNSTKYEYIKKVKIKDINNNSGDNNGYADFTNISTELYRGQTKTIKLKPGFKYFGDMEYWRVWVDWNQDGVFDAEEKEIQKRSWGNVWDQISVPNDAALGATRMRVSMAYGGYATPCDNFEYGEVEDYTIIVKSVQGFIAATSDELNLVATTKNNQVQLDWVNNTGYKNEYFIIEKSLDGKEFTPIAESNNKGVNTEMKAYSEMDSRPEEGTNLYRVKLILNNGEVMYSEIKTAEMGHDPNAISLYPNPAVEEVFINLKQYQGENAHIMLANSFGQVLYQTKLENIQESAFMIPVNTYDAGHYTVSIKVDGKRRINKTFVKTRL